MEKINSLNRYQKGVLIFMIAMALVFAVIYPMTISQAGKIQGKQAHFTVSKDKTVVFQYGDKTYGPYTAKEDPTVRGTKKWQNI